MGSKGSQNTQTAQAQTYAPTGAGYIQSALQQGQNAAQLPFNIPQAPVAGFSQDQQSAFNTVNNAQGSAQPYYNQAQSLYGQAAQQPNVANFYNPMASAVTAQMQNIFGQQQSQDTGQLTQAAGGVGADRIAVGQGNLANQQALAAGQTYAGLYGQAQSAAQAQQQAELGAGSAMQGLGTNVLNAQLTGAQAQLGTGGLQQQLSQAQLNAPYQLQLAQAAFPYQQAQFNAGITGALAPGLGGTTSGQGQTTSQYNPSLLSQILGGAGIGTALAGYASGSGNKGASYGGGSPLTGDAYGGSASAPLSGLTASDYGARGGVFGTYARGGSANPFAFAAGGSPVYGTETGGESDEPIDVDQAGIIPQGQLPAAQVHMPNLNLNPPAPSQSNSGSGIGQAIGDVAKIAGMFMRRGGRAEYADGGVPYTQYPGGGSPYAYAQTGDPDTTPALFADRFPGYMTAGPSNAPVSALAGTGMTPQDAQNYPVGSDWNPYRTTDPAAMQAWRDDNPTPDGPTGTDAMGNPTPVSPATADSTSPPGAAPTEGAGMPSPPGAGAAAPGASPDDNGPSLAGFLKSPYMALLQAGLGAFTPQGFAGGLKSGLESMEKQQTIDQSAKHLAQEAQFHQDQFTKSTPYQQFEMQKPQQIGRNLYGQPVFGVLDKATGTYVDPVTRKPVDASQMGEADDAMIQSTAKAIANYDQPPISPYKTTTPIGMAIMNKAREINPNYDAKNYAEANAAKVKFGSGPQGDAIRSFGTAYRHIDLAERMIDAMQNGDSKLVNTLKNEWKTVFGTSAAPNNFEAAKAIVSDEIIKAVLGSRGALGDRNDAQKHLDAATSPKLLHAVIEDTYKPLMIGQLQGYKHQYESATHGAKDFGEKLSPEVSQDLDKAEAASAAKAQAAQANAAAPAGGGAAGPPVGTRKQFKQGWGVWDGSKWAPEKP